VSERVVAESELARRLRQTWADQGRDGFLLTDPAKVEIPTREALDESCGVRFRFRWMPHREIRGDVAELQRRGILNLRWDESRLFRDPRDPQSRFCFLCADNIRQTYPKEVLVPLTLAGREYLAGANFAWIEPDHYTVMTAEHVDQDYSRHALQAMIDLHLQTGGQFRVLFNGNGAGASIPWHLHFQITTTAMPIERMPAGREPLYPTAVRRFRLDDDGFERAHRFAETWLAGDRRVRSVNVLLASPRTDTWVFVFPRDQRHAKAEGKGLVGGFEVAGDFVLSAPGEEATFRQASAETARDILRQVCPPDWPRDAAI
jgi:hypothetical protein